MHRSPYASDFITLLGLFLLLFVPLHPLYPLHSLSSLHAQTSDTQSIQPDGTRIVDISAVAPALLTYDSAGDELIDIRTRALNTPAQDSALDTTLAVIAPDGQLLAYNDDTLLPPIEPNTEGPDAAPRLQRDAELTALYLPQAGAYTLRVDSFNGVSAGQAEVTLTQATLSETISTDDTAETRRVYLLAGRSHREALELAADSRVTISAQDASGTLDPLLRLIAPDGRVIASNDDHNSDDLTLNVFDAQIRAVLPGTAGRYTVEIRDFTGAAGVILLHMQY
jgi:hypothetical protein